MSSGNRLPIARGTSAIRAGTRAVPTVASPALFDDAVSIQHTFTDHELSFTDAMTVAMVEHHDIDGVVSFDDNFDGIVTRFDPQTLSSR